MRLGTKAAAYGIAGLVLAGAVIVSGSSFGFLNLSSFGTLSVLLTDPPSVPDGVSAVYITYSSIAVHAAGFGDSGWVTVSGQGTFDSMKLVNLSQTISTKTIPSLTYNLIALNISKAQVEFLGKNYSGTISSGKLVVPIIGGLKVNSSSSSVALVDIQPTVINLGTKADPSFAIATGAKASPVPATEVTKSMKEVGNRVNLEGRTWFHTFKSNHSGNPTGTGISLTPNSLSFSVSNHESSPIVIKMVLITPDPSGGKAKASLGSVATSAILSVQSDGSLRQFSGTPAQVHTLLEASGYSLAAGATRQFSFSGAIVSLQGDHPISSGSTYFLVIIGSGAPIVQLVVAS
jgi:hypothetical protein